MKKFLPIILALVGLGAGIGAGVALKPAPPPPEEQAAAGACDPAKGNCPPAGNAHSAPHANAAVTGNVAAYNPEKPTEFVKLSKQFVVPIIKREKVNALVVMSISIEVDEGMSDAVVRREPKLRDAFLQVLFRHANSGGFDGSFTSGQPMKDLRNMLRSVAHQHTGETIHEVLITDLVKQAV